MRRPRRSRARTRASSSGQLASERACARPPPRTPAGLPRWQRRSRFAPPAASRAGGTRAAGWRGPGRALDRLSVRFASRASLVERTVRKRRKLHLGHTPRGGSARASMRWRRHLRADVAEEAPWRRPAARRAWRGHLRGVLRAGTRTAPYWRSRISTHGAHGARTSTPPRTSRTRRSRRSPRLAARSRAGTVAPTVAEAPASAAPGLRRGPRPVRSVRRHRGLPPPSRPPRVRASPAPGLPRPRARRARASLRAPRRHTPARSSRAPRAGAHDARGPRGGGGRARRARRGRRLAWLARRRDAPWPDRRWSPPTSNATRPDAPRARRGGDGAKTPFGTFENVRTAFRVRKRSTPRRPRSRPSARRSAFPPTSTRGRDDGGVPPTPSRRSPRRAKKRPPRRSLKPRGSSARRRRRRTARRDQARRE